MISLATFALFVASVSAANLTPNYEVKLLMDPTKVLGSDYKLIASVRSQFSMPTSVTKMNVQFLDTDSKEIYNAGWSPRIRKTEGDSGFELTYKKRYPVNNDDQDGSLSTASNDGFDADSSYEAQIEWGWQKKTLSIGKTKSASGSGYSGMDLPGQSKSRELLQDNAPDKFNDYKYSNWGIDTLSSSRIYGPVLAKRSIGTWNSTKLYIEVWPIRDSAGTGTEYLVEASLKVDTKNEASGKHDALAALLQSKGWFLAQDSLKTQQIMDRY